MTRSPRRVASALKLDGPSAQPRIRECKSASLIANMRRYSSKERPHGTTRRAPTWRPLPAGQRVEAADDKTGDGESGPCQIARSQDDAEAAGAHGMRNVYEAECTDR